MKVPAVVLLLACALPAAAQRPEIIEFTPGGTLTWSNAQLNACYTMELTWNLEYNWIHMESSMRATQSVMRTEDGGDLTGLYYNVLAYARALGDTPQALYFRILTSPDPIRSTAPTNWLRVSNASTSALENLVFGLERHGAPNQSAEYALLPPHGDTAFHAFSMPWPDPDPIWWEPDGYFISYTQAGIPRSFSTELFVPIGPPRKDVTIIVSNDSYTVGFDWLPFTRTTRYD